MKPYVSLHNHTIFSIMDSLIKPAELFKKAKELNQPAIAITDHNGLGGAWDGLKYSRESGVKLIIGSELCFIDSVKDKSGRPRHVILLARNQIGYRNLLKLIKEGNDNGVIFHKKNQLRIDWDLLEKYHEGLICLTACAGGILGQSITAKKIEKARQDAARLKEIFGDYLGLEIQPNNMVKTATSYHDYIDQKQTNHQLIKIGEELNIRVVATTNAHYVNKEDHQAHDVMLAIGSGQPIRSRQRIYYDNDFYMKSRDEIYDFFARLYKNKAEEFCDNSLYFANLCEDPDWIDPKYDNPTGKELPLFPVKDQENYDDFKKWLEFQPEQIKLLDEDKSYLRYVCELSFKDKVPPGKEEEYRKRLEEEFDVFESKGFSSYMLIVADYLDFCRKNGKLVGPGRGSIGGSMVGYLINIHQADPIKYDLIFARFQNKERTSYPDCDSDFSPQFREQVEKYLQKKYGIDNVAHVSNYATITSKVYARDISRTFEFGGDRKAAVAIGNAIADSIPDDVKKVKDAFIKAPLFVEYSKKFSQLKEYANLLDSKPRQMATHAAGIVIGRRKLADIVPLRKDADGTLALEYEKQRAEENGLVKFDLLGLETLDIISNTYDIINSLNKPIDHDATSFNYENNDHKTYDLITSGDTLCVFQLGGSGGTTELCKQIKPKSIEDVSIINALARPSAAEFRKDVIEVRNGNKKLNLLHPRLERALGKTYSVGLYEECLLYVAQDIAGWDLNKADDLRKFTKDKGKNPEKAAQLKKDFVDGAVNQGLSRELGIKIYEEVVENFQGYGFNKSLSVFTNIDVHTKEGKFITSKIIKDILPGEYVRSRDETTKQDIFVEVVAKHDHGILPLVEVELDTGEKVKCTMDHKFRVKETGKMFPLWKIIKDRLSIVVKKNNEKFDIFNIKSIKVVGLDQTYDLEVNHPDHQFYLSNGMLTSNSHSILYSLISYHTAYLKAHYKLPFLTANLISEAKSNAKSAKGNILKIKEEIRKSGVTIVPPNINQSLMTYKILDDDTLLCGIDAIKFTGKTTAPEILAKRPFRSFEDFILRVDSRNVRANAIQALAASGCLDEFGLSRKQMFLYAGDFKKKFLLWSKKNPDDIASFKYPWPDNVGEWTDSEKAAMEIKYLGEALNTNLREIYPNFFPTNSANFKSLALKHAESDEKRIEHNLTRDGEICGVIRDYFEFRVKKETSKIFGQTMAKITVEDLYGNSVPLTVFPDQLKQLYSRMKQIGGRNMKLEPGVAIAVAATLEVNDDSLAMIFLDLKKIAPPPQLPKEKELEPRSVKMKISSTKKRIKKIDNLDDFIENVEDQLTEQGDAELEAIAEEEVIEEQEKKDYFIVEEDDNYLDPFS